MRGWRVESCELRGGMVEGRRGPGRASTTAGRETDRQTESRGREGRRERGRVGTRPGRPQMSNYSNDDSNPSLLLAHPRVSRVPCPVQACDMQKIELKNCARQPGRRAGNTHRRRTGHTPERYNANAKGGEGEGARGRVTGRRGTGKRRGATPR